MTELSSDTAARLDLFQTCEVVCSIRKKGCKIGLDGLDYAAADAPCKPGPANLHDDRSTDMLLNPSANCSSQQQPLVSQCNLAYAMNQAASSTNSSPGSRCCGSPAVEYLALGHSMSQLQVNTTEVQYMPLHQSCPALGALDPCTDGSTQSGEQGVACSAANVEQQPADETAGCENPIVLGSSLFFARVPPTVTYESILELFAQFGKVQTLNLFRPWASAKTSKGCGIVVFTHIASVLAAMEALHNKYHWTGGETTMVVEWADPSRHRRENPNTKGVFEAKHKALAMAGSKSRYRAQMRRAVAFSLQQACAAAGAPHLAPVATGSRAAPMAHRGVAAMLPQLAGPVLSSAPGGPWGLLAGHGAAAQDAYTSAIAAAAASQANGMALSAAWLDMAGCSPAGGVTGPDGQRGTYPDVELSVPCSVPGAIPLSSGFMPGGWGHLAHAASTASLAMSDGSVCSVEPGSPAFAPGMLHQTTLRPVMYPSMLQQNTHYPSRFGPAAAAAAGADSCASDASHHLQQHSLFSAQMQHQSVSYLSANAGLVADASMVAAAAAAVGFGGHTGHEAGLSQCCTPLAGSQVGPFAPSAYSNSHMGAAFLSVPFGSQQQPCLLGNGSSSAGVGGVGFFGSGGQLVPGLVADSPCDKLTYSSGSAAPTVDAGFNAVAWHGNGGGQGMSGGGWPHGW